ncbi:Adenine nucleotide alpha hydrolases-like superfamily protein [Perilla frutescens var. hirtella]|uniref:Adenine nucleotide alpha hydrolases-like superfamily protein n=1 Tax=Perilla frutescens var. hirtella TaxID=608512 RepID=A0AAD4IZ79_PERFH|nr:Adenine nucleotide alpha hydrolases-like superfamily protein [Perilla frutescens var. hirtella]
MKEEKRVKKVVVAVDESEESMYALSWCLSNLLSEKDHNPNSTLILLYVKPPVPSYNSLDVTGYIFTGDVIATVEKHSRDLANSVMKRAEAVRVEKKVGSGDAKDVICVAVDKLGADILVMGSHDYGHFWEV